MAALLPARGYPLGLGEIELNSALNQELNAEIEILSASPEDAEQLIVQLGSREAFNRAGIDRPYLLQQLKFKVVDNNGVPYIKVYTNSAVREPFLSFLLEIDWPQGNLLREYTLLLDPPVYNTGVSAGTPAEGGHPFIDPADTQTPSQPATQQYYPDASAAGAATISSDSGRSMSYQAPTPSAQARQSAGGYAPSTARDSVDKYRVKENDTLWSMANRMRPDNSVSVEQMMLALVRKNPEAFIQENINGVKRGYILRVPDRDEALQINRQQALSQAREHAALWREYTRAASSATPASAMEAEPATADSSSAADADSGQLSIVGAGEEAGSEHAGSAQAPGSELERLQQELAYAREQLESERIEKETLRSRLSELEQKVQSVINMDDAQLAELQQSLQQDATAEAPAEELATDDTAVDELAEEAVETAEVAAEMAEDAVEDMAEATDELATDEATEGAEAELTDEVLFTDELAEQPAVEESADTQQQMDSAIDTVEPETAIEPPPFAQKQPKSFIDSLLSDQKMLAIVGGGLAFVLLLLALLLKRMRGRKADTETAGDSADKLDIDDATMQDMDATTEMMAPGYEKTDAMDDTQIDAPTMEEEPVDDSVFNLDEAEKPAAAADQDDVLAEADVYLAYGIYQQAEDLLKKAIEQDPERDDYRMKLLEVHYAAKDAHAFEQLAQEAHSRKGSDSSYWGRVAAMGAELVPGSALFAAAGDALPGFDADAVIPEKPATTDLELDADDQGTDTTELELPDSDESATGQAEELDLASDLAEFENEVATDAESPAAESAETDVSSELEFDLGELSEQDESLAADDTLSAEDELDLEDEDFSLDFDAADLGFEEPEDDSTETENESAAVGAEDELNLDEDLDLSVALDESSESEPSAESTDETDLDSELSFDASELNLDEDSSAADDEISLDMDAAELKPDTAELDLDDALELTDDSGVAEIAAEGDEDFDISELSEDIDEVATKLDLAKAYMDMGDSDGARSILEEVKAEGNEAQQQEAEALLQQAD
jgi:pilus assembly protein FimV